MLDDDDSASSKQADRRKLKNRRMSTNVSAAEMLAANRTSANQKQVHVYMLDGTHVSFAVTPKTKTRHALLIIKDLIELQNDADFGLFELRGGFAVGTYHLVDDEVMLLDAIGSWNPRASEEKFLAVGDPQERLGKGEVTRHLVFRRRLYLPWSPLHREVEGAKSVDDIGHHLEYIECIHHCMYSRYPLSKDRAVQVCALMLQQELGDWAASKYPKKNCLAAQVKEMMPKYALQNRKLSKYEARAVKAWKELAGYTPLDAQQKIIELCKFWFPWYGCEFFRIDFQRKLESAETRGHMLTGITVCIGHGGMHFLYRTHGAQKKVQPRMLLASHKYASIDKWITSKSGKVFSFYLGDTDLCFIVSSQSRYIESLVREYIFEYMEITAEMKVGDDGEFDMERARKTSPSKRERKQENHDAGEGGASGDGGGSAREKAMAAVAKLAGGADMVRVPFATFKAFHGAVGFAETAESLSETISGAPGSAGNAVACAALVEHIVRLPVGLQNDCFNAADALASGTLPTTLAAAGSGDAGGSKHSQWEAVTDDTGRPYYYHKKTRRSVWNLDDIAAQAVKDVAAEDGDSGETVQENPLTSSVWVEVENPDGGKPYYFNQRTGETSWSPNGEGDAEPNSGVISDAEEDEDDEKVALRVGVSSRRSSMAFAFTPESEEKVGGALDVVKEEEEEEEEDDAEDSDDDVGKWAEMLDPSSGDTYYVNNETGESQWDMPEEAWVEHEHEGRKYWHNTITGKGEWRVFVLLSWSWFFFW